MYAYVRAASSDLNKLQEGIGEKIGMFVFFMTICLASLTNAFYHGWELTLVMFAAMPILMVSEYIMELWVISTYVSTFCFTYVRKE